MLQRPAGSTPEEKGKKSDKTVNVECVRQDSTYFIFGFLFKVCRILNLTTYSTLRHVKACLKITNGLNEIWHHAGLILKISCLNGQRSFWGIAAKVNVNRRVLEIRFLYGHPLQIRQGFAGEGSIECTCVFPIR